MLRAQLCQVAAAAGAEAQGQEEGGEQPGGRGVSARNPGLFTSRRNREWRSEGGPAGGDGHWGAVGQATSVPQLLWQGDGWHSGQRGGHRGPRRSRC